MPAPGTFVLHSRVLPALPADAYTVHVEQAVDAPGAHVDALDVHVEVTAPRYTLPPDQVLSTFPPNEATGAFSSRLPQIVLRRRTLPWERTVLSGSPFVPWLALIVLEDGEGEFKTNLPVRECVTTGVQLPPRHDDATVGDCITVSSRVARRAFPTLADLARLAHVREVDLTDTELALGDDDGWLAVVVANRLPLAGRRYGAYLISIEGQATGIHFALASQPDADTATKPLPQIPEAPFGTYPVLAHWSFTCAGEGDFQSLMQELDVGMLGTLPPPPQATGTKPPPPPRRAEPPEVLATGHLALDHVTRDGEPRRAWYRGPCVPRPGTRDAPGPDGRLALLHVADQARRVGPDGRENLSLAAAFEIGRLLALAEPSVVAALLLWRRDGFAQARAAALLAADPVLAALGARDVGSGLAARAAHDTLAGLGAGEARRLGPVRPLVPPGIPLDALDGEDPVAVVAAGFGLEPALLRSVLEAAPPPPTFAGAAAAHPLDALAAQAGAALDELLSGRAEDP